MIQYKQILTTLALLLTAVTGAWAQSADPEVTWNAATKTGSFTMPDCDVEIAPIYAPVAAFDLKEGSEDKLPAAVEGIFIESTDAIITAGSCAQGTLMYAVSTSATEAPALTAFSADLPTAKDITTAGDVYVWYYIKGADTPEGQEATEKNTFNDSEICTTPLKVTVLNNKFNIEFNAANANTIEAGKATVKVGDAAATVTEGKLEGVKMNSKVTITAKEGYKIKSVTVKKTGAEETVTVTTNEAKTEASFDMPSYDATLEYDIVRNLASKVGITVNGKQTWGETAAYIQVKKQDGEYPAASTLEVSLIDILENNATIASSNYTWKLQRLADDGQTWQDLTLEETKLSPGTYSIVAEAKDGTLYGGGTSGEFDLVEGFEVAVPANEYITYYSEYALYTNDEDAQLYTIASVTDIEAVLSDELEVAPAETPLLIFNNSKEAKTFLLIPTDDIDLSLTVAKEFKGTLEDTTIPASSTTADNYALNGLKFVWVKSALEIGAHKCWIEVSKSTAKARSLNIVGGNATGISTTNYTNFTNDDIYDLQGRKVLNPTKKGIYIKNGQKVVIK